MMNIVVQSLVSYTCCTSINSSHFPRKKYMDNIIRIGNFVLINTRAETCVLQTLF
jgi:hypothetical protein